MSETNVDQPNIVVVMYDQLTPAMLGCYGHPSARSPRIDALAAEGVVFDAAYSNSPLCTPARYCMMTGQLPSTSGGYDNAAYLAATIPTFAHFARAAGYRTVLSGKMHFVGPDQLHGFEERRTTDIYPADFGWTPDWDHPGERVDWWYHNMDSVIGAGVAEVDQSAPLRRRGGPPRDQSAARGRAARRRPTVPARRQLHPPSRSVRDTPSSAGTATTASRSRCRSSPPPTSRPTIRTRRA